MALNPLNAQHQLQIDAGIIGRKKGHKFEEILSNAINKLEFSTIVPSDIVYSAHNHVGNPALRILQYIAANKGYTIFSAKAWWLGGLATSGDGDHLLDQNGNPITKCKSDVLIEIDSSSGKETVGVSVKTCAKKTPTNDQMFFTTARAFCQLLEKNGIAVSEAASDGLSKFCGDAGNRPLDLLSQPELNTRISDPNRFYWEELSDIARKDWEDIFLKYQDDISRLLFQKAYKDDPFPPDFLLHQKFSYSNFEECPVALFSIDEIVALSHEHSGFILSPYVIRKGTYKNDNSTHYAPRFGFIQFQRGGQKQHPTQLQFNLKAGYFNLIP
jgi:hypothetical protein